MQLVLHLDTIPTALNRQRQMHWAAIGRENKKLRDELWAVLCVMCKETPELRQIWHGGKAPPAEVEIFIQRPRQVQDRDNRVACVKGLVDGLVRLGVLRDDNDEWLTKLDVFETVGEKETELRITYQEM